MHFWNKLSTAALMRLTILASLNLLLGRILGRWDILLHPLFFLVLVTLNLGLYAVMVYTGTLNKTLIGMMLGGLAATLVTIWYGGMGASTFLYGTPFWRIGMWVADLLNRAIEAMPAGVYAGGPLSFQRDTINLIGYAVVDASGVILIVTGGLIALVMNPVSRTKDTPAAPPSS
jgi:hypothetical protein